MSRWPVEAKKITNGEIMIQTLNYPSREEWLEARVSSDEPRVGSSEIATLLGYGYASESPYTLWSKKTGRPTAAWSDDDLRRLEAGQAGEGYARRMFELETGMPAYADDGWTIRVNDKFPAFAASLDSWTDGPRRGIRPVELKIVGRHQIWEYEQDELPEKFTLQVQHQVAVTDADVGYLCAVCGTDVIVRDVPRHDRLIAAMHAVAERFLWSVATDTPPEIDGSEATAKTIAAQFPDVDPDTVRLLDSPEFEGLAARRRRLKAAESKIKDRLFQIDSRIKHAIGSHEYAVLPGDELVSWKRSARGRVLRQHPRIPRAIRKAIVQKRQEPQNGEPGDARAI